MFTSLDQPVLVTFIGQCCSQHSNGIIVLRWRSALSLLVGKQEGHSAGKMYWEIDQLNRMLIVIYVLGCELS